MNHFLSWVMLKCTLRHTFAWKEVRGFSRETRVVASHGIPSAIFHHLFWYMDECQIWSSHVAIYIIIFLHSNLSDRIINILTRKFRLRACWPKISNSGPCPYFIKKILHGIYARIITPARIVHNWALMKILLKIFIIYVHRNMYMYISQC